MSDVPFYAGMFLSAILCMWFIKLGKTSRINLFQVFIFWLIIAVLIGHAFEFLSF